MSKKRSDYIKEFSSKTTEDLLEVLKSRDSEEYPKDAILVVNDLLEKREEYPFDKIDTVGKEKKLDDKDFHPLLTESNGKVMAVKDKVWIKFPKDGYIVAQPHKFPNKAAVLDFLGKSLTIPTNKKGYALSGRRIGKYHRINAKGDPVFTFGEPILDLITDEMGWLTIGNEKVDLRRMELQYEPRGGIKSIDLSNYHKDLMRAMATEAIVDGEKYRVLNADNNTLTVSKTNQERIDFYQGGDRMVFKAWKRSYWVYWSMGAEIETWGEDFDYAQINSDYGNWLGNSPHCGIVKRDSDSDSNDDYLDEYEWGIFSSPPTGVRSLCQADWHGYHRMGTVWAGDCEFFF